MPLAAAVLRELEGLVGRDHLLTSPEDIAVYAYDATPGAVRPAAVVLPGTTQEIAAVIGLANRESIPIIPRGSGTNLSGGSVPVEGGIVLTLLRLNRILEVDEANLTATAQPGVVLADLQQEVEARGLFYPPDPSSLRVATLGGTVAEGAGGPRGVKYGTTKDYVLGLEVVLPTGAVIRTGGKVVKSVSGYNLTPLFVGSEGTLGVITEITVRLVPLPAAKCTCLAIFNTIDDAAEAVSGIIGSHVVPTTIEFMDDVSMRCIEDFRPCGLPLDAAATLLIEVDGSAHEANAQMEKVVEVLKKHHPREVRVAFTPEQSQELWQARRTSYAAMARARPTIIVEDATVPRPQVPAMVRAIKEAAARHNVQVGLIAHAGDGNMHPQIMCDARDHAEMARVEQFIADVFRKALDLGGSLTGEHGIGTLKAPFLVWQFGQEGVAAMRAIKQALDPNNILNPGKIFAS